ncbi:MerR family transcriptional regulator [Micromonospora sp. NPDC047620]|uniref:MerR family transcriptional regulator n=1 Tax=Micromonospora sp. NPDC047620 TaxID=3364251 RepID=UPI003724C39D
MPPTTGETANTCSSYRAARTGRMVVTKMRIRELSSRSGLSVPTIKYYLREGLLQPGRAGAAGRQLYYDERHLSRLRLIRMLIVVGRMSLASVREVLQAIDNRGLPLAGLCAVVNEALFAEDASLNLAPERRGAADRVDSFVDGLGWRVADTSPGRRTLTRVLTALERLSGDVDADVFVPYAEAAVRLAALEAASMPQTLDSERDAATVVARAVLLEAAMAALRRMAREHLVGQAGRRSA